MKRLSVYAATAAIVLVLPLGALAHEGKDKAKTGLGLGLVKASANLQANGLSKNAAKKILKSSPWRWHKSLQGSVSTTTATGFTLVDKKGTSYSVNTSAASIVDAYGVTTTVKVGDNVVVQGAKNGTQINASVVVVIPPNTHRAEAKGTVTAVSGNTITLEAQHRGITYPVTVKTNASTTVMSGGNSTTTAAVVVGSKISVKGLWDEVLKVLNAIKIKIRVK